MFSRKLQQAAAARPPAQLMEAKVVGTPALTESASGSEISATAPSTVTVGEYWIAHVSVSGLVSTPPSGWTEIINKTESSAPIGSFVYYHKVTGSEPTAYTWSGFTSGRSAVTIIRLAGIDQTTPLDATPVSASTGVATSVTVPQLSTVTPGALLLSGGVLNAASAATLVVPSGMSQLITTTGTGRRQSVASETRPDIGATGSRVWGENPQTVPLQFCAWLIAFRPASPGSGGGTTPTVPEAPTLGAVDQSGVSGSRQATIAYAAPTDDGGAELTQLNATITPSTGVTFATHPSLTGSTTTITGLADSTSYTYSLSASNTVGTSSLVLATFTTASGPSGDTQPTGAAASLKGWSLVFEDTFPGTSIDTSRWNVFDGKVMNKVTCRPANVAVTGGELILTLSDSSTGAMVSSGTVDGLGANRYDFPVGAYTEARVKFAGDGTNLYNWPAWWASGPNWPAAGEHDIAEVLSGELTVNYHSPSGAHNQGKPSGTGYQGGAYHVYGVYRKATSADVYWDGILVESYPTDDNGLSQSLILNIGVHSSNTVLGSAGALHVDYVRAWE